MAEPLTKDEIDDLIEDDLEHLIVYFPRPPRGPFCKEDLNSCTHCGGYFFAAPDDLGLCEHCSYEHLTEMQHIQDTMRRYQEDAL